MKRLRDNVSWRISEHKSYAILNEWCEKQHNMQQSINQAVLYIIDFVGYVDLFDKEVQEKLLLSTKNFISSSVDIPMNMKSEHELSRKNVSWKIKKGPNYEKFNIWLDKQENIQKSLEFLILHIINCVGLVDIMDYKVRGELLHARWVSNENSSIKEKVRENPEGIDKSKKIKPSQINASNIPEKKLEINNSNYENESVTKLNNKFVEDRQLSWSAKGLLFYLRTRPKDWEYIKEDIITDIGQEEVVKQALLDLMLKGYLTIR